MIFEDKNEETNETLNSAISDDENEDIGIEDVVSEVDAAAETGAIEGEEIEEIEEIEDEDFIDSECEPNSKSASLINQVEALVFSSAVPISAEKIVKQLDALKPPIGEVRSCLVILQSHYENRGVHLAEVATGWRFQVALDCAPTIVKTLEEKPTRLSRALLETLALVAYRQPITRGEIEAIRGVVVSSHMVRTLLEHEWIRVVGHKDVPGKPALFATTKIFLDDMGLSKLEELPPLSELKALMPNAEETLATEADIGKNQDNEAGNEADNEADNEKKSAILDDNNVEVESLEGDNIESTQLEVDAIEPDPEPELDSEIEINTEVDIGAETEMAAEAEVEGSIEVDAEAETEVGTDIDIDVELDAEVEAEAEMEVTENSKDLTTEKNSDIRSALAALRKSAEPSDNPNELQDELKTLDETIETDSFSSLDDFSEIILTNPTNKTDEVVNKDDNAEDEQNNQESSA
tara:strand:- start:12265 stop:13659 length:1395 start_codon:yes stop_codon:yes gene_type:complete